MTFYTLATPFNPAEDELHASLNGKILRVRLHRKKRHIALIDAEVDQTLVLSTPVTDDCIEGNVRIITTESGTVYKLLKVSDILPTKVDFPTEQSERPYVDIDMVTMDAGKNAADEPAEKAETSSVYGGDPTTIFNVRIVLPEKFGDMAKVIADVNDGRTDVTIFEFFNDELHFAADELNGLTIEQARELKRKRDAEYLQS